MLKNSISDKNLEKALFRLFSSPIPLLNPKSSKQERRVKVLNAAVWRVL